MSYLKGPWRTASSVRADVVSIGQMEKRVIAGHQPTQLFTATAPTTVKNRHFPAQMGQGPYSLHIATCTVSTAKIIISVSSILVERCL